MMNEVKSSKTLNKFGILSLVVMIIDILGLLALMVVIIVTRDQFIKLYGNVVIDLNFMAKIFFSIPGFVYGLFFLSMIVALLVKEFVISHKRSTLIINIVVAIGGIILLFLYMMALYTPLVAWMKDFK